MFNKETTKDLPLKEVPEAETNALFFKLYNAGLNETQKRPNTIAEWEALYKEPYEGVQKLVEEEKQYEDILKDNYLLKEPSLLPLLEKFYTHVHPLMFKGLFLLAQRILKEEPVNHVYTINLGAKLEVPKIIEKAKELNYNLKTYGKFTGVRLKVNEDIGGIQQKYTLMFFRSGKVNCLGIGHPQEYFRKKARQNAKEKIRALIPDLNLKEITDFDLVNSVLSVKVPHYINLKHLHLFNLLDSWRGIKYNNQLFPGVIARPPNIRMRINFFSTGSAIFTGLKNKDKKIEAAKIFLELLYSYLLKILSLNGKT